MSLRDLVHRMERAYDIYDVDPDDPVDAYFSSQDPDQMVHMFEAIYPEVDKDNRFPLLMQRDKEYALYIMERPEEKGVPFWVPLLLFLATLVSTTLAGAVVTHSYESVLGRTTEASAFNPTHLVTGLFQFALPLLAIFGIHEFVQYSVARRYGVAATWPYFVPLPPPLSFLGTMGSLTNLKDPVPDRNALASIGSIGPLAGFATSLFVLGLGLALSTTPGVEEADTVIQIGHPLGFQFMAGLLDVAPANELHPMAVAGWVGLFLTAVNLLPGANLDGGYVARAAFGPAARYVSYVGLVALVLMGFFWWPWFIIALILAAGGFVTPQPLNEISKLDGRAVALSVAALLALILSFTPRPLG